MVWQVTIISLAALAVGVAASGDEIRPPAGVQVELLWPGGAPGALGDTDADKPTLALFPLPAGQANGAAVVVCPGGGYGGHAMDYEGYDVAQWLNGHGVAAFVLKYRVAPYRHPAPLQDAQRALRLVRARAAEFHVDPARVGILGFSAGGHLASTAGTHFDAGDPSASDACNRASSRPDFLVLIYPVIRLKGPYAHMGSCHNLLGENPDPALVDALSNDEQVTRDTPPAFLVHSTGDSGVPAENSLLFYEALRKVHVPAELHVYEKGEHGFGMGKGDPVLSTWTGHCIDWMKGRGIIK
jgi:acetyl esterase/lipase